MAVAKTYNIARMTTATTGTGTITLASAVSGYLSFADAGISDGETVTYAIEEGSNREIGRGVYTASGTTLTRTVLKSTNGGSAINLGGAAQVFLTVAAEDVSPLYASAADKYLYSTAAGTWSEGSITTAGRAILDDAGAAAQCTTLGLGTGDSPQFTSVNIGHASDTTLARVSAGVAAIEGNTIAMLAAAQTWTAVQGYALGTLTYNASQTWDVSANPCAHLSPTGNVTSFSCSGVTAGRFYLLKITQDTSARTIAYTSANFKFIGGSAPTLSTGSGAVDYHVFVGVSSTLLHEVGRAQNVS